VPIVLKSRILSFLQPSGFEEGFFTFSIVNSYVFLKLLRDIAWKSPSLN